MSEISKDFQFLLQSSRFMLYSEYFVDFHQTLHIVCFEKDCQKFSTYLAMLWKIAQIEVLIPTKLQETSKFSFFISVTPSEKVSKNFKTCRALKQRIVTPQLMNEKLSKSWQKHLFFAHRFDRKPENEREENFCLAAGGLIQMCPWIPQDQKLQKKMSSSSLPLFWLAAYVETERLPRCSAVPDLKPQCW